MQKLGLLVAVVIPLTVLCYSNNLTVPVEYTTLTVTFTRRASDWFSVPPGYLVEVVSMTTGRGLNLEILKDDISYETFRFLESPWETPIILVGPAQLRLLGNIGFCTLRVRPIQPIITPGIRVRTATGMHRLDVEWSRDLVVWQRATAAEYTDSPTYFRLRLCR